MMQITRRSFLKTVAATGIGGFTFFKLGGSLLEPMFLSESGTDAVPFEEQTAYTTCWIGKQNCAMRARIVDGRIVKLEGHPDDPRTGGTLCPKGVAQIMAIYDPYRLKAPLKRTNAKGQPGTWVEISWDEALTIVANKIKEAKEKDASKKIIWQKGRSKAEPFYDNGFVLASGAMSLGHGAHCSDAGYRACEYTLGEHGVLHPDFRYCNYLLVWGWNITGGGGNKFCWITWNRLFVEAKERGMKTVVLDPSLRGAGPHADEWLPIKPGTDLAFFLALANHLIAKGYIDKEYLTKYTDAPFLVRVDDGKFLRENNKELVWDTASGSAKEYSASGIIPALDGAFTVNGIAVKTAFRLFKEHIADKTPEWASEVCGLPAEQIRKVAEDLGINARIGSTIVIDSVTVPYRPVAIAAYHVTQTELGFQACRAAIHVMMLLGAIGAAGGQFVDTAPKKHANYDKLNTISVKDSGYKLHLDGSKYYPISSKNPSIVALAITNPTKYGFTEADLPDVLLVHMANPVVSYPSGGKIAEAYRKFKFIAVIDCWMSETADYFADIILPAATLEKYEGPYNLSQGYVEAHALRLPIIPPLYNTKGEIDIYIELGEKAGILYGKNGFIDQVNKSLNLPDAYKLDVNTKPTVRDIFDRWAKAQGISDGVKYFEERGVKVKGAVTADRYYGSALKNPYNGVRHRLYGEALKRYQDDMKKLGVGEIYYQDYTAFPTWREPTMNSSPSSYDLTLISSKMIEFKQSRSTFIALLNELNPEQRLIMSSTAAKARGIKDGDAVWVESHNAVTGETRKVQTKAMVVEYLRPDTVVMPHHYGLWVHPHVKNAGPSANTLFYTGEGYTTNTGDQSFQVKVKVWKVV
jgi:anaerobic selenocysteine-containing dehydrogenase